MIQFLVGAILGAASMVLVGTCITSAVAEWRHRDRSGQAEQLRAHVREAVMTARKEMGRNARERADERS